MAKFTIEKVIYPTHHILGNLPQQADGD